MKLSTGKVAFPIEFDNGDKEVIYFNPNDPNFIVKMNDFKNQVSSRIKKMKDIELKNDGTPTNLNMIEEFKQMSNIVCEELDIAFGSNISNSVFKHCSPFAVIDGEYFVVHFINAILPEIQNHIQKSNEKMSKHLKKYIK